MYNFNNSNNVKIVESAINTGEFEDTYIDMPYFNMHDTSFSVLNRNVQWFQNTYDVRDHEKSMIKVLQISLINFIRRYLDIKNPAGIFSVDAEGLQYNIVYEILKYQYFPTYIIFESDNGDDEYICDDKKNNNDNCHTKQEVIDLLKQNGYILIWKTRINDIWFLTQK